MKEYTLNVRLSDASTFSVKFEADAASFTILDLKTVVAPACEPPCPVEQQKLVYKGRILKDTDTLEVYGLESGHTIHLVRSRAAPAAASSTASPGAGGGVRAGSGGGSDTDAMRGLMDSPFVQGILENPDFMRSILTSNPTTRRLMEENPELARALQDPDTLRTMARAQQNPEVMREMMRSNDRALAHIESLPGGFDALRRMYETVQAPLEEGLSNQMPQHAAGGVAGGGASATGAMPNPWARGSGARAAPEAGLGLGGANPFAAMLGGGGFAAPPAAGGAAPAAAGSADAGGGAAPANPMAAMMAAMAAGGGGGGFPGLGGGFPGMGGGGLGGPGMGEEAAMSMLSNPAMRDTMLGMLASPGFLEMIEASNPALRGMLDSAPGMREMMRNPEVLRGMLNPDMMRMAQAARGAGGFGGGLGGGFGGGGGGGGLGDGGGLAAMLAAMGAGGAPAVAPAAPAAPAAGGGGMDFGAMMAAMMAARGGGGGGLFPGGGGAPGAGSPAAAPAVPPAELYASQLAQMEEMGLPNREQNLRALQACAGNVQFAVNRIYDGQA